MSTLGCFSGCSSSGDNAEGQVMQPTLDANGMPMPGNLSMVKTMFGAGSGGAGAAGVKATGAAAGTPATVSAAAGAAATVQTGVAGAMAGAPSGAAAGAGAAGHAAGATGSAAAGSGAAGGPAANGGAGASGAGSIPMSGADACGPDAMPVKGTTQTTGNGSVLIFTSGGTEVLSTTMTMLVPKKPTGNSTLFLWPGLQPSSAGGMANFGVLQPVLTWGGSCNGQRSNWWISGQYVYFSGGFGGAECETGALMDVDIGDKLDIEFVLNGKVWTQNITNQTNMKKVNYDRDLKGQKQVEVLYEIESPTSTRPSEDVIFTNTVIKLSASQPEACVPRNKGMNDYVSPVRASADGKTCCIDKVILRAAGVAMTSPNTP